jgi:hypothetical protein
MTVADSYDGSRDSPAAHLDHSGRRVRRGVRRDRHIPDGFAAPACSVQLGAATRDGDLPDYSGGFVERQNRGRAGAMRSRLRHFWIDRGDGPHGGRDDIIAGLLCFLMRSRIPSSYVPFEAVWAGAGATLIIGAHLLNLRFSKQCQCCEPPEA